MLKFAMSAQDGVMSGNTTIIEHNRLEVVWGISYFIHAFIKQNSALICR